MANEDQSEQPQRRRDFTLTDEERAKIARAQAAGRVDPWRKRIGEGEEARGGQGGGSVPARARTLTSG